VRHYADLYVLAAQPDVIEMLKSDEYRQIKDDYDEKSRAYFPNSHRPPPDLCFKDGDALFPPPQIRAVVEPGYEEECQRLFFKPHPSFADVLSRFEEIRQLL
jgi:hypothetical protein